LFKLLKTDRATEDLRKLEETKHLLKRLKAVRKALGLLQTNPKHPGLNTHKYETLSKEVGYEVFEAYAENKTPCSYRIFWHYGPGRRVITIIAITPHP
jgi:hypothetical protein